MRCPAQQRLDIHQLGALPMRLQKTPAAFTRLVVAVIRRGVPPLDGFAGVSGEVPYALEELSPYSTACRPMIDLQWEGGDGSPLGHRGLVPPVIPPLHDDIAGLAGTAKGQIELSTVLLDSPEGDVGWGPAPLVIGRPVVPTGFP